MSGFDREPPERFIDLDPAAVYTIKELRPLVKMKPRTMRKYCERGVFANAVNIGGKTWFIPGCDILKLYSHLDDAG